MLGNNQWGSAVGSIPGYDPIVITVQKNDAWNPTFDLDAGATIDIALDLTLSFTSGEKITSASFSTDNAGLTEQSSATSGNFAVVRLSNAMPQGMISTVTSTIQTSIGQTIRRSFVIVCRMGPSS